MKNHSKLFIAVMLPVCLIATASAKNLDKGKGPKDNQLDEPVLQGQAQSMSIRIKEYWTPEKMHTAQPMPIPEIPFDEHTLELSTHDTAGPVLDKETGKPALPGFAPGWRPGQAKQPEKDEKVIITPDHPYYAAATGETALLAEPQHGAAPSNPLTGPYGPFQRWTVFDSITTYPKSTHGRLFFSFGSSNFSCSATVINRSTLITAGHCNHDGNQTWATNRLFCPNWRNGQHSTRGCWPVIASKTSAGWRNNGDPDYDYACLITSTTGTKIANSVGNVTGWMGRAWNFSHRQQEQTFGYPAGAPFNGSRLMTTASPEWYSYHFRSGGQISKLIGSDLTGGSSGGSWVLGWHRSGHEIADTDGSMATDPGSNWVNGVNSHKRCLINCQTPPTATNGVFWQEMSSPPFRNTSSGDETEDIISVCLNNGGSN